MKRTGMTLSAVALLLVVGGSAYAFHKLFYPLEYCESRIDQLIPGPSKYDVKVIEEGCDGIGGSDTMSVVLSLKSQKKEVAVFEYGRKNVDPAINRKDLGPTVKWDNDNLRISIDMILDIKKQIREFDGIKINYDIGHVVYNK